jgi:hypothetical protein
MQPFMTVSDQETQAHEVDDLTSADGGWGAFVVLAVIVAALALAALFLTTAGEREAPPPDVVPEEAPLEPGS